MAHGYSPCPRALPQPARASTNLTGVDIDIPRETLTVITGLRGSGKSSLAFGTI